MNAVQGTVILLAALSVNPVYGQALFSESFDTCGTGDLICEGWAGDGSVETLRGDQILVLRAAAGESRESVRVPSAGYHVLEGHSYRFSAAVRTDSLRAPLSLGIFIDAGGDQVAHSSFQGVQETSSWHRMDIPFTPTTDGQVGLFVRLGPAPVTCGGGKHDCGLVYVDDIVILESPSADNEPSFENICPEGQYANLAHSENNCEALHVVLGDIGASIRDTMSQRLHVDVDTIFSGNASAHLGFDPDLFRASYDERSERIMNVAECDGQSVQFAVGQVIEAGGGKVRLPACTISLDRSITITGAANLIIEGQGIGRTILETHDRLSLGAAISVQASRNVIIRDMSFHLNDAPYSNIETMASTNVLVERVLVTNAGSASIRSAHTTRMTVRYSALLYGPKAFSDSGCQGHFFDADRNRTHDLDGDGKGSTRECEMRWGEAFTPGSKWSASYSAYSNITYENSFALHQTLGEIAGNRLFRSTGNKLSDGLFWWIHDNEFRENESRPAKTQSLRTTSDGIVDRVSRYNLIYQNRFIDNINGGIRIAGRDNFVIRNTYRGPNRTLNVSARNAICDDTEEYARMLTSASKRHPAVRSSERDSACDLVSPGTFWSRVAVSSEH